MQNLCSPNNIIFLHIVSMFCFFKCYLGTPQTLLGHYWEGSITHLHFNDFDPFNKVAPLSPANYLAGFSLARIDFFPNCFFFFFNFMTPFYGWDSTASRLEPLQGGSVLFTTKFPEIPVLTQKCWFCHFNAVFGHFAQIVPPPVNLIWETLPSGV